MNKLFALDIETDGLDRFINKILCIGVWEPEEGFKYFDSVDNFNKWNHSSYRFVTHNGSFDCGFLKGHGADIFDQWLYDTKSLSSISYPSPKIGDGESYAYSLSNLAKVYLGIDSWKSLDRSSMGSYDLAEIAAYNAKDCEMTYKIWEYLIARLKDRDLQFVESWLQPATKLCAEIEFTGVTIDQDYLKEFSDAANQQHEKVFQELSEKTKEARIIWKNNQNNAFESLYGDLLVAALNRLKDKSKSKATKERYEKLRDNAMASAVDFNFRSVLDMKWLLKDCLKLDIFSKRKDRETTDEAMLKDLAHKDPIASTMLDFREIDKLVSTSIPALSKNMREDGRVHAKFNVGGTVTGRLSSSGPNLQQVPKTPKDGKGLRGAMIPKKGHVMVSMDYGQIEPRIIAHASGDKTLLEIFNSGWDLYSLLGFKMFGKESGLGKEKVDNPHRNCAKTLALSCFYGVGSNKVIEQVFKDLGIKLNYKQAQSYINDFLDQFPAIVDLKTKLEIQMSNGSHGGYTYSLLGRPITIENSSKIRDALNFWTQGSASDLLIYSVFKHIKPLLKAYGIEHEILLLVHDEVVFSIEESMVELLKPELEKAMTKLTAESLGLTVPLKTEIIIKDRWLK